MDFSKATIAEINEFAIEHGYDIASCQDRPSIGDTLEKHIDWQGIGEIESVQDICDALQMMAYDAQENARQYSLFEIWASAINGREDSEEAWEAYDEGINEGILKYIEENREDIVSDVQESECVELGIEVPAWIEHDIILGDVEAIQQGGCASGAYMPAVTYALAQETMAKYGDDVLDYIQETLGELPAPPSEVSWSGLAVYYLSCAIELWASSIDVDEILSE